MPASTLVAPESQAEGIALSKRGAAYPLACLALAALAVLAILFASSRWGIGMLADSTVFVGSARSLLASGSLLDLDYRGRVIPMMHSAPLYPASLAGLGAVLGVDPLASARILSAICFGLNVAIMGWLASRWLKSSWLSLAAALMMLVATPMFDIHATVLSEPLFLVFALTSMGMLAQHLESPSRKVFFAAALLAALAGLTRYAGVALLGAEVLLLLFLPRTRSFASKLFDSVLFGAIASAPLAVWLIRNRMVAGTTTTARVSLDHLGGAGFAAIWEGVQTYSSWLLPGAIPPSIRIGLMFVLAGFVLARVIRSTGSRPPLAAFGAPPVRDGSGLMIVLGVFGICHLVVTTIAMSFLYSGIPLDDRNLLPTLPSAIMLVLWSLRDVARNGGLARNNWAGWLPGVVVVLIFAGTNAPRTAAHIRKAAAEGRGYASRQWQESALIAELKRIGPGIPVYSSLPSAIRFLTGLPARLLPKAYDLREARDNPNYEAELEMLQKEAHESGVAIAFIGGLEDQGPAYQARTQSTLGLISVSKDSVGTLMVSPQLAVPDQSRPPKY